MSRETIDKPEWSDPDNKIETPADEPVIDGSSDANPPTNKFRVYVKSEKIDIPLPKKAGKLAEVAIGMVQDKMDEMWRFSYSIRIGNAGASSPISGNDPGHESRERAVRAAGEKVREFLVSRLHRGDLSENERGQVEAAISGLDDWTRSNAINQRAAYPNVASTAGDVEQLPLFAEQILAHEPSNDSNAKAGDAPSRTTGESRAADQPSSVEESEKSVAQVAKPVVPDKAPWQMTQEEYNRSQAPPGFWLDKTVYEQIIAGYRERGSEELARKVEAQARHLRKFEIKGALHSGKPVPHEILADYPDLQSDVVEPKSNGQDLINALHTATAAEIESKVEEAPGQTLSKTQPPTKIPTTVAEHMAAIKVLRSGEMSAADAKRNTERLLDNEASIKAELNKLTIPELKQRFFSIYASANKKKDWVNIAYEALIHGYLPNIAIAYQPFSEPYAAGVRRALDQLTDDWIQKFAADHRAKVEGMRKAVTNPETLEEFEQFIRLRKGGESALTAEQLARYDELIAQKNKTERREKIEQRAIVKQVDVGDLGMEIKKHFHSKMNQDVYIVTLSERVDRAKFDELNMAAKKMGGWYSRTFHGSPAGFAFKTEEDAQRFLSVREGDVSQAERVQQREEEKQERRVTALRTVAESLEERANEALNTERKVNTAKRAQEAAHAETQANADLGVAQTMKNLAEAIESGEAAHTDGARAKTHVETFNALLESAKWERSKQTGESYEQSKDRAPNEDDIQAVKYPYPAIHKEQLQAYIDRLKGVSGAQLLTGRLRKKLMAVLVDENQWRVEFRSDREIADYDLLVKKAALNLEPWKLAQLKADGEKYKRLQAMGIIDEPSLRAALREYLQLRQEAAKLDPIKQAERDLINVKILGFVPTTEPVVDDLIAEADLREGMDVLEPSAGMGKIADAIRARLGVAPTVVEFNSTLRKLLELKGYTLADSDFLKHKGEYDRIVMNPPFEDGQDIEHIQHAYSLLRPGGKVVAVMSEGAFNRPDKQAMAFREWLKSVGGRSEKLPEGSFKDSERPTGVNTRKVIIDKRGVQNAEEREVVALDRAEVVSRLRLEQERLRSAFMAELRSRLNRAVWLAELGDVGLYDAMDIMSQRAFGDFAITDEKGEHHIRHGWAELDERSKRVPESLLVCVQSCRDKDAQAFQRVFDFPLAEAKRRFERIDRYCIDAQEVEIDRLIEGAIFRLAHKPAGSLISPVAISTVRAEVRAEVPDLSKEEFDTAVRRMAERGALTLLFPSEGERNEIVEKSSNEETPAISTEQPAIPQTRLERAIAETREKNRAREEAATRFIEEHGEVPFQAPVEGTSTQFVIAHRSTKYPGKWQFSLFDELGPVGDMALEDYREGLLRQIRERHVDLSQAIFAPTTTLATPAQSVLPPAAAMPESPSSVEQFAAEEELARAHGMPDDILSPEIKTLLEFADNATDEEFNDFLGKQGPANRVILKNLRLHRGDPNFRDYLREQLAKGEERAPELTDEERNRLKQIMAAADAARIPGDNDRAPHVEQIAGDVQDNTQERLQDVGLLREFGGRWQYKFRPDGGWFTSNTKEGAIEEATKTYDKLPQSERITTAERGERKYAEKLKHWQSQFAGIPSEDLEKKLRANRVEQAQLNRRKQELGIQQYGTQRSASLKAQLDALAEENDAIRAVLDARGDRLFNQEERAITQPEGQTAGTEGPTPATTETWKGAGITGSSIYQRQIYYDFLHHHKRATALKEKREKEGWLDSLDRDLVRQSESFIVDQAGQTTGAVDLKNAERLAELDAYASTLIIEERDYEGDGVHLKHFSARSAGLAANLPEAVQKRVGQALDSLRAADEELERARGLDKQVGGEGRYESETFEKIEGDIKKAHDLIDEFRRLAPSNNVDAEAFLTQLGGVPEVRMSSEGEAWRADQSQKNTAAESALENVKPVHFEAGRQLTEAEKKEVLRSLGDSYKDLRAPKIEKGVNAFGELIVGYEYNPAYMHTSDITGHPIRYYIKLPDGRIAHPTELFPNLSKTEIDQHAMAREAEDALRESRNRSREQRIASPDNVREGSSLKGEANARYQEKGRKIEGSYFAQDEQGRVVRVDGKDPDDAAYY